MIAMKLTINRCALDKVEKTGGIRKDPAETGKDPRCRAFADLRAAA
jgi:hypothetical protein